MKKMREMELREQMEMKKNEGIPAELKSKSNNDVKREEKVNTEVTNNVGEETRGNTAIDEIIERINENKFQSSPFGNITSDYYEISNSVCKIRIELKNGIIKGTGFFLEFIACGENFRCLISNEHVIQKNLIDVNTVIYILYDNEKKTASIKLNNQERYIKDFKDLKLDITVVEILKEDNIPNNYFLTEGHIANDRLIDSEICILGYPEGGEIKMSKGNITKIDGYEFTHLASTEVSSSGSPIFMEKTGLVLGIHKQGHKTREENYGDFIYPAIKIIKKDLGDKRFIGKYVDGKYIYENHRYYKGEFKNNMPNGKGKLYDKNGTVIYEGDFIKGKFEGNGKIIQKGFGYYIGSFMNGSLNGKGKIYDKNGKIVYEGYFKNDNLEGNGQIFFDDSSCFTGQFENNFIFHGKLTNNYDDKTKAILEVEFVGKKYNGNCKYISDNGIYFIFPIENSEVLKHEGKMYDNNGNCICNASQLAFGFVTLIMKLKEDKKCVIY
jgi:hypothetical protein